jgi:hypothetical protein
MSNRSKKSIRIIPACAGSTVYQVFIFPCFIRIIPACAGSTMYARICNRSKLCRGIIPACAGSTICSRASNSFHIIGGSSPHVRGAQYCIPQLAADLIGTGDHPRMCGEHYLNPVTYHLGYSVIKDHPRMCGEHFSSRVYSKPIPDERIIPACAGSTYFSHDPYEQHIEIGSSPHVRGALSLIVPLLLLHTCLRIIPACAGSTTTDLLCNLNSPGRRIGIIPACAGSTPKAWLHLSVQILKLGSSPHVRGARLRNIDFKAFLIFFLL